MNSIAGRLDFDDNDRARSRERLQLSPNEVGLPERQPAATSANTKWGHSSLIIEF